MKEEIVIETKNLTKYYGSTRGIENLNLEVYKGEIFGLLGPNGAGKTTVIRVLLDLIRRTSGEARIFGLDVEEYSTEIRQRSAYLPGDLGLYKDKTARQNLQFLFGLYDTPVSQQRIEELADRLRLDLDRKVKELSKGNKQKVAIILALAPRVELLILDEPTSGLDPLITIDFYRLLHEQQKEIGSTVLLSSHLLGEVERVANRVGVIREGTIAEMASIQQLKKIALKEVRIEFSNASDLQTFTTRIPPDIQTHMKTELNETQVALTVPRDALPQVLESISQIPIKDLDIHTPDLEEIFLKYYESPSDQSSVKTSKKHMEVTP